MNVIERRETLKTSDNPGSVRQEYVVTLCGDAGASRIRVCLRYVPDRLLLAPESFYAYLSNLTSISWESLEALAVVVLDDVGNEVVPRWHQVTLRAQPQRDNESHSVVLEDRQPNWSNPDLLRHVGGD